ncbi:integrating conjugative element protein [uncultured Pseudoteredinibacter sp.]|uniref:integrating conjugative element protein n=1 Tax=uncultured Pseudoteredinibacter sp. TaxID=1641701 RepID=UPI00260E92B4|nr:integrating conjugative element protein [uncultured Pseudoteredinibacter sp.]
MRLKLLSLLVVSSLTALSLIDVSASSNKLIVIYDSGNTKPIDLYLPKSIKKPKPSNQKALPLPFKLPIDTPSMSPGGLEAVDKKLPYLNQPFFLIGADTFSKQWLVDRLADLKAINAVGYVVEVKTLEELKTLTQLADGIRLAPVSGEFFAQQLGIRHYPVLISNQGWEQ